MGLALYHNCYPEAAITVYNKTINLKPNQAIVYCYLGNALCEISQHNEAINAYKKAIEFDVSHSQAYLNLALVLFYCYREQEALEASGKAIQRDSFSGPAYIILSTILGGQQNVQKAREALEAAQRPWLILGDPYNSLGVNLYDMGGLEEAVDVYLNQI